MHGWQANKKHTCAQPVKFRVILENEIPRVSTRGFLFCAKDAGVEKIEVSEIHRRQNSGYPLRTHTQVFAKWNGKWCEAPDNTSPVLFGENGYDSAKVCISAFTDLFRAYYELGEKYDENHLLVKELRNTVVYGLTDEEYLSIARSN
ncbi:MAG: hypothetical protein DBX39_04155 [Bacillota bacterium]|nr:MAG: hypothetical protein DBX39_04155 [Bacillota bacterium]